MSAPQQPPPYGQQPPYGQKPPYGQQPPYGPYGGQPQQPYPGQPMQYGPPVPPVNKPFYKHGCFIAFAVVAVLGLLFMGGCAIFVSKAVNEVDKASKTPHVIRYEVTGNSKGAQITYGSLSSTSSATTLPFKKPETVK